MLCPQSYYSYPRSIPALGWRYIFPFLGFPGVPPIYNILYARYKMSSSRMVVTGVYHTLSLWILRPLNRSSRTFGSDASVSKEITHSSSRCSVPADHILFHIKDPPSQYGDKQWCFSNTLIHPIQCLPLFQGKSDGERNLRQMNPRRREGIRC